jgi:hypothetical protein
MLGRMPDMTEIDRQLDALGRVPDDIQGLLARNLGGNRSPAALDRMLHELGGSFTTASYPPPARTPTPVPAPVASATHGTQEFPFGINAPTQSIVEALTNEDADDAEIQTSEDDDFEMLIEDEEILEIQEDDVEEDEPSSES